MKQILSFVTVFALAFSLFTANAQDEPKKTSSKKQTSSCSSKSKSSCGSSARKSKSSCGSMSKSKAAKSETSKHDCKASECGDDCSYAAKAKSDDK